MKSKIIILLGLISYSFSQVSIGDINRLSNQQIDIIKNQLKDNEQVVETEKSIDLISPETVEIKSKATIDLDSSFGYQYFRRDINFFENIPLPDNYRLGPGDEIILSIWGETNIREKFVLNKDGLIFFENLGFINISDKSLQDAELHLKKELSKIYSTLNKTENKSELTLEAGKLKSINVYFSGEVSMPGINLIHPFSDIFTALVQVGGINNNGSLRSVQLIRDGQVVNTVDFYKFFMDGQKFFSTIKLVDGDVIHVPLITKRVSIGGSVVRAGTYELLKNDSLNELIGYAGGLSPSASSLISIESISPIDERISNDFATTTFNTSYENSKNLKLSHGDIVRVNSIQSNNSKVEVIGNVKSPGDYPVKGNSLKDVLDLAGGFNDPDFRKSIIEDKIIVLRKDSNQLYNEEFLIKYSDSDNFQLSVGDKIFVYENSNFNNLDIVSISGEVVTKGSFQVKSGMTIGDVINMAGGFTDLANKDALTLKTNVKIFDEFGNAISSSNSILNPSLDFEIYGTSTIQVLPKSNVVLVDGNVYNPGAFAFDGRSLRSYINSAGGMKKDTLKNKVYVQRANGKIKKSWTF